MSSVGLAALDSPYKLLAAVVDNVGDLTLQIAAADDAVDEAVLQQELGGTHGAGALDGVWPAEESQR